MTQADGYVFILLTALELLSTVVGLSLSSNVSWSGAYASCSLQAVLQALALAASTIELFFPSHKAATTAFGTSLPVCCIHTAQGGSQMTNANVRL